MKRRLKPWAATFFRVVRALALTMMVIVTVIMAGDLWYNNYVTSVDWTDVGRGLVYLAVFIFWFWLVETADDMLQYE